MGSAVYSFNIQGAYLASIENHDMNMLLIKWHAKIVILVNMYVYGKD